MAAEGGRADIDLKARLLREPYRFDFFQAVRLLERIVRPPDGEAEEGRRSEGPGGAGGEWVRFRSLASLSFPAGAVAQVRVDQPPEGDALAEMVVSFLGLTGPSGVLPQHYTMLLLRRLRNKDTALRDFFGLFEHRLVSHFYRAWEKYRLPFAHERSAIDGRGPDLATAGLYCFAGLGTEGLRGRLEIADEAFLYYSGHFSHFPRSAAALEAMLADYFGLPIEVRQLQGAWMVLGEEDRSRMPGRGSSGRNNSLGGLVVGRRTWDVQGQFRLRVGPLGYREFCRLMPSGDCLRPMCQLARTFVGPELAFDVQPVLRAAEVPRCTLRNSGERARLGWNTWLHSKDRTHDAEDAVFALPAI